MIRPVCWPRLTAATALLLSLSATGIRAQTEVMDRLVPVPEVDLRGVDEAVRTQIAEQRKLLDDALAAGAPTTDSAAQLGLLFGEAGQLYLVYDLLPPARACLANAAELQPRNFRWRYLLGSAAEHLGQLEEAVAAYEQARALQPDDPATAVRLGRVYLELGQGEEARTHYERALDLPGTRPAAHFGLGRLAAETDDPAAALEHFQAALREQPRANSLHYHIALAQRALGNESASRAAMELRGEAPVAFADPIAAEIKESATGIGAQLLLGRVALAANAFEVAETRFREAVADYPESAAAKRSLAAALERMGRSAEAAMWYQQALDLSPNDAGLLFQTGRLYNAERRHAAAAERLRRAAELEPAFGPAWVELAAALTATRDYLGAAEALTRALELAPGDTNLRFHRARNYGLGERRELALRDFESLLADFGHNAEILLQLGRIEGELGRPASAARRFEQLIAAGAEPALLSQAHFALGNIRTEQERYEEAIPHYQRAIIANPTLKAGYVNLSTALGRLGQFKEAALASRRALELDPTDSQVRAAELTALLLAGEDAQVRLMLEETLQLPDQGGSGYFPLLLAQVLAASEDDEVRNGEMALRLAQQLFQSAQTPAHGAVLAMAYAATDDFEEAAAWQERLIESLERTGPPEALEDARERLTAYRAGRKIRAPWRR
jgi:tetratricopeptide (TPR) repeat protein